MNRDHQRHIHDGNTRGVTDNEGPQCSSYWRNADGRYTCPKHYHVPIQAELDNEDEIGENRSDAYNSFLKLPSTGYRDKSDGSFKQRGGGASGVTALWTATPDGTVKAIVRAYTDIDALSSPVYRADGVPVRCIHK